VASAEAYSACVRKNQNASGRPPMLRKYLSLLLMSAAITTGATAASAQDQEARAYTEGAVVVVSYVRTEPGMFDDYMSY
jgi:hypothetical protein